VDKAGQTIDFRLIRTRDVAAAKAFFKKAIRHEARSPHTITWTAMRLRIELSASEQDHRGVKSRTRPMLGFKTFESAAITIAGVELLRRIHKDQFALNQLQITHQAAPAIWNAVPAA
jgi:transposase-like protein